MILERVYRGLILHHNVSPEEQILGFRRDKRFVTERVLPAGVYRILQDKGTIPSQYQEMEMRISQIGTGALWGRRSPSETNPVVLPVQVGNRVILIVKQNTPAEEKIWEVHAGHPWHVLTSLDTERGIRRIWREYEYREGYSPYVQ